MFFITFRLKISFKILKCYLHFIQTQEFINTIIANNNLKKNVS